MAIILTVDTQHILRERADRFLGINMNYIRDAEANRPGARPLSTALKDLRVRWLRYPGGGKSDYHLWAKSPYTTPQSTSLKWYSTVPGARMDVDQYMTVVRTVGAEPYIVVGYDTYARTGRTTAQWRAHAVSWVRYANVTKGYGVRYWEIGNENWNKPGITATSMATLVVDWSRAMRAVDPTIQVGSGGNSESWWAAFLPIAAPALDWLSVGLYPCWEWGSYDAYLQSPAPDLISMVRLTEGAIASYAPSADRQRLRIIMSETNSVDWSQSGWAKTNTLGHAVVTFDTLGQFLQRPSLLAALVWTTRWMDDAEATTSQFYALGLQNGLQPTGRALQVWGQFLQAKLIAVSGGTSRVSGYASRSATGSTLIVWVINRGLTSVADVQVNIHSTRIYTTAEVYQLRGTGVDDPNPRWGKLGWALVSGNTISGFTCPRVSVTVLRCRS